MLQRAVIAGAVAALMGQQAIANAPARTERPLLRPGTPVVASGAPEYNIIVRYDAKIRPKLRPGTPVFAAPITATPAASVGGSQLAVHRTQRPKLRPRFLDRSPAAAPVQRVAETAPTPAGKFGSICGSRAIRGQKVSSIPGKLPGCGVSKPVRVSEVSGVRLSTPSVMDCDTAKALSGWVRKGVTPAVGRLGGGVAEIKVIAHYSCRTRNNKPGGKISEHGKGKAVDVAGLTLKNGAKISVLKGWSDPVQGKVLRAMHKSACGPFGTVLGPNADKYHKDHLHLDTARHRGGAYCR